MQQFPVSFWLICLLCKSQLSFYQRVCVSKHIRFFLENFVVRQTILHRNHQESSGEHPLSFLSTQNSFVGAPTRAQCVTLGESFQRWFYNSQISDPSSSFRWCLFRKSFHRTHKESPADSQTPKNRSQPSFREWNPVRTSLHLATRFWRKSVKIRSTSDDGGPHTLFILVNSMVTCRKYPFYTSRTLGTTFVGLVVLSGMLTWNIAISTETVSQDSNLGNW